MNMREVISPDLLDYWSCLYDFKQVYDSCFGILLSQDYRKHIFQLEKSIERIVVGYNFKITPKIHIILRHVPDFICFTGKPLGIFSEQTAENSHSIFQKFWIKYSVKDVTCEQFEINLLKCIHDLNSAHL